MSGVYQYPARDYVYDATVIKIEDGDTVHVKLDLGCDSKIEPMKIRMNGINARGKTTAAGKAAVAYLQGLLPVGSTVRIETLKDRKEKYGRYLGVLHHPSLKQSVNAEMVELGLVEPYYGVGKAVDSE
jgi:endonuclease YncB( thermonuclease family)